MDKFVSNPKFQAFDVNGDPLSGGFLYTLDAGGSITDLKTTYTDRALSVANTNPIVLDSRGECVIFCEGTLKLVLQDEDAATIWTIDNLKTSANSILSDDDADTYWDAEESADEDKLRGYTGDTQRIMIDSDGVTLAAGASVNEFSIDATMAGNSDDAVPTEKAAKGYVDTHAATTGHVPVGTVVAWPTGTPPTGYLELDGSSLARATYAALFAVISDDYGAADGDHFTLPDCRGRFLRAWAHGQTTDPDKATRADRGDGTGGDHVGTLQAEGLKAHTHTNLDALVAYANPGVAGNPACHYGADVTGSTGGNETRPVNINVMFCIKY